MMQKNITTKLLLIVGLMLVLVQLAYADVGKGIILEYTRYTNDYIDFNDGIVHPQVPAVIASNVQNWQGHSLRLLTRAYRPLTGMPGMLPDGRIPFPELSDDTKVIVVKNVPYDSRIAYIEVLYGTYQESILLTNVEHIVYDVSMCGNGVCDVAESELRCARDCPAGSEDGYYSGRADNICDFDAVIASYNSQFGGVPRSVEEFDIDCALPFPDECRSGTATSGKPFCYKKHLFSCTVTNDGNVKLVPSKICPRTFGCYDVSDTIGDGCIYKPDIVETYTCERNEDCLVSANVFSHPGYEYVIDPVPYVCECGACVSPSYKYTSDMASQGGYAANGAMCCNKLTLPSPIGPQASPAPVIVTTYSTTTTSTSVSSTPTQMISGTVTSVPKTTSTLKKTVK